MKLTELNPRWVGSGGEGVTDRHGNPVPRREGVALSFDCPCERCSKQRVGNYEKDFHLTHTIMISNPIDGGPSVASEGQATWTRTGETFDILVISPSILSVEGKGGCGWHGFIGGPGGDRPGEVVTI